MKPSNKIRAFTLSEMLVVLLLTTIVVGMAFAVLRLVQQQMEGIQSNYERNTQFNLLQRSLWFDFNQNDGVWYDPYKEELVFSNGMGEMIYEFHKDEIITLRDTFELKIVKKSFFLNGLNQQNGEIDAMDIELSKTHGGKQLFVFKRNAATTYMNK